MIYLLMKWMVALVFFMSMENAKADDVYNFYFQKSPDQKLDDLMSKRKASEENKIRSQENPEVPKKKYKKWEANLGWGTLAGSVPAAFPLTNNQYYSGEWNFSQQLYVLGLKYNMSRYFEAQGSMMIPHGPLDQGTNGIVYVDDGKTAVNIQLMFGVGTTPFHFDLFGLEFMELGWDLSVVLTEEKYLGGKTAALVTGPRMAVNFSKSFAVIFSLQRELDRDSSIGVSSARLAYRW